MLTKSQSLSSKNILSFLDFLHSNSFSLKKVYTKNNFKIIKLNKENIPLKIIQRKDFFYICSNSFKLLNSFKGQSC